MRSPAFIAKSVAIAALLLCGALPAVGQAAAPKWYTVSGGVLTIQPNNTTANVAGIGDSFRQFGSNGALVITCLVFGGGTSTQNGAGVAGTASLTVFAQIGGLFAARPCTASGSLGTGCTLGFTTSSTTSPVSFTSTLPFPVQLGQLGTTNIATITRPSLLYSFAGSCVLAGTASAFTAPNLQVFLTNGAAAPANASKECSGTAPATLQGLVTPFPQSQLGSGTLSGTQGTSPSQTSTLAGTLEIWRVPAAVTLTSASQICTAMAVLLTTA